MQTSREDELLLLDRAQTVRNKVRDCPSWKNSPQKNPQGKKIAFPLGQRKPGHGSRGFRDRAASRDAGHT
ncbi:hypothetical protein Celaphus_00016850 [Cervus elaphus hippelaphus]|uniref:Uncharacterized protein n=1 Tax=Cervus elaphus hippelaphus TaxID=46360 RepID=A0A212C4M8_CEREH|nr:hypothetical protein Celaphus_00016850 [Cervus elaphus hippelaphus]